MKKRVRVYKPGGQTNQPTQEQIVDYISQKMSADDYDGDTDALKDDLAGAGIDEDVADEYIASVSDDLGLNQDTVSAEEQQRLAAEEEARAQEEEQALLEEQNAEEEARQQQLAAMYNTDIDMSTTEDTPEDEATYMKQGGSKLSKRTFIKQYTKFAKMARGGDTPSPGADDVLNGREAHVKGFLGAVKNTAQEAALKAEAEAQYNSIYGAPQVGAFQEGGIQQEEVDIENPMHHIGAYAAGLGDIFRNNQNIQNDVPQRQLGGFTDTDSGLYKFIGGGDNESADEEYQDADLDYNQYAKGGFKMPRRSGRQYTQAVGSPYYTATGEAANPVDLANRKVTSVDVTKRGIFGRPKAYTINYDGTTSATPAATPATPATPTGEYMPPNEFTGDRQPIANWMMRTGIPGIKQMGARMTRSGMIPEVPQGAQPTTPVTIQAGDMPYYPPLTGRAQRRERRDDAQLNRFLGNKDADVFNDPKEVARIQQSNPGYVPFGDANKAQAIANQASSLTGTPGAQNVQSGPLTYTDSKPYPKEQEAQINDIKLQDKAANDDMLNSVSRKATNYDYEKDASAKAFQNKYPSFQGARNEEFWFQQQPAGTIKYSPEKGEKMRAMGLNPDTYGHHYLFENPDKLKEYGGPVDYTEYAYGGDVSIPELYRADNGIQTNAFDPNANPLNLNKKDYKGDTIDFTGRVIKKRDPNFSLDVPELKVPGTMDKNYTNPLTGEKPAITAGSDGNYVDNTASDLTVDPKAKQGTSEDYLNKKNWDKTRNNSAQGKFAIDSTLDTFDQVTANRQQNQFNENLFAAESNFGISNEDYRGDHDQAGNFRPDDTGFKDVSKYGGGVYATGGSIEDEDEDTLWMTQEEIDEFRANGGELEFY